MTTYHDRLKAIADRLDALNAQAADLEKQIADLEAAGLCNATPHWRDKDRDGRKPKLYAIHSIDEACPIHGDPPPNGRLRTYIGTDPEKQAETLAAMDRRKKLAALQSRLRATNRHVQRIEDVIKNA